MRRYLIALVTVVVTMPCAVTPARAITFGSLDENGHPNVGALVAESPVSGQKDILCTGTLIALSVFLTAAHCTSYLESLGITQVWVTFDAHVTATSTLYLGTMHTNPGYNPSQSDPGDIAVITFSTPVTGITPATLPTAGLFDQLAAENGLHDQAFTAVGYGVHQPTLGGGMLTFPFDGSRWVASSTFDALNPVWLRLSQNHATGEGGTCYGDSGGPNFVGNSSVIGAITVTGDTLCLATSFDYRLDTPTARAFLANYVTLP